MRKTESLIRPDDSKLGVGWIARHELEPNEYNPSENTGTERDVLKNSIIDNSWTQPLLITPDRTIIDGETRWFVSRHPDIREDESLTPPDVPAGYLPVVVVDYGRHEAMQATYQLNEATGSHDPEKVADVVENTDSIDWALDRIEMDEAELEIVEETGEDLSAVELDADTDEGAFTEAVSFDVADRKAIETHIGEVTGERLVELSRFILETATYEAVDVPPPDWDQLPDR